MHLLVLIAVARAASPSPSKFYGTDCLNVYSEPTCINGTDHCLPGIISNCFRWKAGKYEPPLTPSRSQVNRSDLCTSPLVEGKWEGDYWKPTSCGLHMPSPSDIFGLLQTHNLIFIGDSLCRQMYINLAAYLRGQATIIEALFHSHSTLTFSEDGSSDNFNITDEVKPLRRTITFIWASHGFDPELVNRAIGRRPTVAFVAIYYWRDDVYYDVAAQIKKLQTETVFYFNTPLKGQPGFPSMVRNYEMYKTLSGIKRNLFFVPTREILSFSPHKHVTDNLHFQCGYTGNTTFKSPPGPPGVACRDLNNRNLLRIVFTMLLSLGIM